MAFFLCSFADCVSEEDLYLLYDVMKGLILGIRMEDVEITERIKKVGQLLWNSAGSSYHYRG